MTTVTVLVYPIRRSTECLADLDEMIRDYIIFEPLLTTFDSSSIFEAVVKIGLSLKSNHHYKINLVQIPDTHCNVEKGGVCTSKRK